MRTEHQRHHRQPQNGGRGGGGTVGETPHPAGRLRQQGGQDIPDRAGAWRRRGCQHAARRRQMPALRQRHPRGKQGVQLLQLRPRAGALQLLDMEEHRWASAHAGGSGGNLHEKHHVIGT